MFFWNNFQEDGLEFTEAEAATSKSAWQQ
jgi:hypothetical protein